MEKICNKCKKNKNIIEFYKDKSKKDGYRNQCKNCESNLKASYHTNNDNNNPINEKICNKCNILKTIENFSKDKYKKNGYCGNCKNCESKRKNKNNPNNTNINENTNENTNEKVCNKCNVLKNLKDYHKDKSKKDGYRGQCKKCELENKKIYYQENKDKRHEYEKNKYNSDEEVRIKKLLRTRFILGLKNKSSEKTKSILEITGCDLDFFKKWIEYQYKLITNNETIDWEDFKQNYHMDHLMPCSSFNLTDIEEQKKCFHWKNIQILTKENNLKKSNTIISQELIDEHNKKINNFLKINI